MLVKSSTGNFMCSTADLILGPPLSFIYVHNLPSSSKLLDNFTMFRDDIDIFCKYYDIKALFATINK